MSEPKFTPGPWHIEHDSKFDECVVYANREEERVDICEVNTYVTVSNNDNCIDVDQIMSNADLIHAAPDMYDALEEVCHDCDDTGTIDDECTSCSIYKALRKARGETE